MDYAANTINSAAQNYAAQANVTTGIKQILESEALIQRLAKLRSFLRETNSSINSAAEKIVGAAPTAIGNQAGIPQTERPPAANFLDAIGQALTDLERTASDLSENASRFHRCF